MIKCRTGVIPVGAGSVHPARAYFLHDQNCHTFAEALKRPIWLSWTEYAESNRAGEHISHLQPYHSDTRRGRQVAYYITS